MFGILKEDAKLPATTTFSFPATFKLQMMKEIDITTGEQIKDAQHKEKDSEGSLDYTVTLSEGRGFVAGFELEGSIYDRSQMGGAPLASLMFVPPSDLAQLSVGFLAPSKEFVGAGTDVELLGESAEGEVYGIVRANVKKGERQTFVVAFGSRAERDAALAAKDAESQAASEAARQSTVLGWLTTPAGLIVSVTALIIALAVVAVVVLLRQQQRQRALATEAADADWSDAEDEEE
jgi:hypothetical protein